MKVNQMNSQPASLFIPLGLSLMLALGLTACGDNAKNSPSMAASQEAKASLAEAKPGKAALTVTTIKTVQNQLPMTFSANGNITAWQEASVGSLSNGLRINQVLVNVGDVVNLSGYKTQRCPSPKAHSSGGKKQ